MGGRSAGYHLVLGLILHLTAHGYDDHEREAWLVRKITTHGRAIESKTVDDFFVLGSTQEAIDNFQTMLNTKYAVKPLGKKTQFLGWKVTYPAYGGIKLAQPKLANTKISNALITQAKRQWTKYQDITILHAPREEDVNMPYTIEKYQVVVEDLRYLADCTRPDLNYVAGCLGTELKLPTYRHWNPLKVTIWYLIGTRDTRIVYNAGQKRPPNTRLLQWYVDSSFSVDTKDRKSTMGIAIKYNGTNISWISRKKSLLAM